MFLQPYFKQQRRGFVYLNELDAKVKDLAECALPQDKNIKAVKISVVAGSNWKDRRFEEALRDRLVGFLNGRTVRVSSNATCSLNLYYDWVEDDYVKLSLTLNCSNTEPKTCKRFVRVRR